MVNVSSIGNNFNIYDNQFASNPFANSDSSFYNSSLFSNNNFSLPSLSFDNFDFFTADLNLFNMLMSSQMSIAMQQDYFTDFYNTKTDIKSLKDVYNPDLGNKLANIAAKNASRTNTIGWCAKGTNDSIQLAGLASGETRVASAYQEADKLAKHKNFKEVSVSREDLKKLPAGCVIVWNKTGDASRLSGQHGHTTITLGNGKEASDHVQDLIMLDSEYRVFVPVAGLNQAA